MKNKKPYNNGKLMADILYIYIYIFMDLRDRDWFSQKLSRKAAQILGFYSDIVLESFHTFFSAMILKIFTKDLSSILKNESVGMVAIHPGTNPFQGSLVQFCDLQTIIFFSC